MIPTFSFGQLIEKDKQLHLLAGFGVAAGVYEVAKRENLPTFVTSVGASTLIGLAKELVDEKVYKGFDLKDLLFTSLGGVIGWAFLEVINVQNLGLYIAPAVLILTISL